MAATGLATVRQRYCDPAVPLLGLGLDGSRALPSLGCPAPTTIPPLTTRGSRGPPPCCTGLTQGVARVTINRPERRNAMSWEVMRGLRHVLSEAAQDSAVRVVVLAGSGDDAFCAGADLGKMTGADEPEAGILSVHEARGVLADVFGALWQLGKPTVARVQGFALAGGFGLALACDLVVASERARFGAPEVNVGLWPYMITVPLVRSMPPKQALELMLTGRMVDADRGTAPGLCDQSRSPRRARRGGCRSGRDIGGQVAGRDEARS